MKRDNAVVRILFYFMGLFIMTIGISLSVKSNLGVSPVSAIPYTMTVVWGIEMGKATIIFHTGLVLIQMLILRRQFQARNLLQILVGVVFGYFTTFCNDMVGLFPNPHLLGIRLGMMAVSVMLIAAGIFFYVPADIMPLASEGIMIVIAEKTHIAFSRVKVSFDVLMVVISLGICLLALHQLGSVGIGTVIAAICVGLVLGVIAHLFGGWRYRVLHSGQGSQTM